MGDKSEMNNRQEHLEGQRERDTEVRDDIGMKGSGLRLIERI